MFGEVDIRTSFIKTIAHKYNSLLTIINDTYIDAKLQDKGLLLTIISGIPYSERIRIGPNYKSLDRDKFKFSEDTQIKDFDGPIGKYINEQKTKTNFCLDSVVTIS